MPKFKYFILYSCITSLFTFFCCIRSEDLGYYDYYQETYLDTIACNDTLELEDSIIVHYYYPVGCNVLDRIEIEELYDTIFIRAITHFYYHGTQAAHGSGVATKKVVLEGVIPGDKLLIYTRYQDSTKMILPVYIQNY